MASCQYSADRDSCLIGYSKTYQSGWIKEYELVSLVASRQKLKPSS